MRPSRWLSVLLASSFAGCTLTAAPPDGPSEGAPEADPELTTSESWEGADGAVAASLDAGLGASDDAAAAPEEPLADEGGEGGGGEPLPTAECPLPAQVVIYTQDSWNVIADAFASDPSPCAHYYVSIPAIAGDKTSPRGAGQPERMRARGSRFHAMAELHYWAWVDQPGTWYARGVEFRRRMEAAGYRADLGDLWAINELPSLARRDPGTRRDIMELLRGLHDGPPGAPPVRGAVFVIGMAHSTTNTSVYEPQIQTWLEERAFWESANRNVRFWSQEVYADPMSTCVPGTTTGRRAQQLNEYVEHFARLAEVGPDSANTAQSYLGRAYVPLMNAMFLSPAGVYGNTQIPLEQMKHFVSQEVYAARAWASSHAYPDGRVGFAWGRYEGTDAQQRELAARLASAVHHAYGEGGGGASRACSPSGAFTWCQCSLVGARFNDAWESFSSW